MRSLVAGRLTCSRCAVAPFHLDLVRMTLFRQDEQDFTGSCTHPAKSRLSCQENESAIRVSVGNGPQPCRIPSLRVAELELKVAEAGLEPARPLRAQDFKS